MDRFQPETTDNSRVNEVAPLLQDEEIVIDDELYALGGAVGGSTAEIHESIENSSTTINDASGCDEEAINEAQADIDIIVRTLFSAWMQSPPRGARDASEFINPRAHHAMSTAWRQIKAEREILPEHKVIVRRLAEVMVHYIYPHERTVQEGGDTIKKVFTQCVAKLIAEGWKKILDEIEEEEKAKERERKRRERRRRIRERLRRQQEVAEVLRFYAPFARIDYTVPLNCRTFCLFLCQCCSIFIFQVPIHTLLLSWPVSIGVMGGLYMTQCPMSQLMPYVMIALGAVGTLALLMRLSFVIYEKLSENHIRSIWPWMVLKVIEFTFLDFLIIQLFYFYSESPSSVLGSPNYCDETFYSFVHYINYVSIALVSAWIFVYFTKGLLWLRTRNFRYTYR